MLSLVVMAVEAAEEVPALSELARVVDEGAASQVAVQHQFASLNKNCSSNLQMVTPALEQMLEKALMAASKLVPQSLTRVCLTLLPFPQISLTLPGEESGPLLGRQLSPTIFLSSTHLTALRTQAGGVAITIWINSARTAKKMKILENMSTFLVCAWISKECRVERKFDEGVVKSECEGKTIMKRPRAGPR